MGSVHLVRGTDPSVVGGVLHELVQRLVGDGDRSLLVEELDGDEFELGTAIDAARTPPFLTDHRVVVVRGLRRFYPRGRRTAASDDATVDNDGDEPTSPPGDLAPLLAYLADPSDTTDLVLDGSGLAAPRPLLEAVKKAGGQLHDADVSKKADRAAFIAEHVAAATVRLDPAARSLLDEQLGEEVGRLPALLQVLEATYGDGATVRAEDVLPYLGDAGGVPPWEFTDAIDAGDVTTSLRMLDRMLHASEPRHPLQLMAVVHGHYTRMMRLDGSGATNEQAAAQVLNLKGSTFAAGKALRQLQKLGHDGLVQAVQLLARADLDLRGLRQLGPQEHSDEVVLQVLVARLARLSPRGLPGRATARR